MPNVCRHSACTNAPGANGQFCDVHFAHRRQTRGSPRADAAGERPGSPPNHRAGRKTDGGAEIRRQAAAAASAAARAATVNARREGFERQEDVEDAVRERDEALRRVAALQQEVTDATAALKRTKEHAPFREQLLKALAKDLHGVRLENNETIRQLNARQADAQQQLLAAQQAYAAAEARVQELERALGESQAEVERLRRGQAEAVPEREATQADVDNFLEYTRTLGDTNVDDFLSSVCDKLTDMEV